MMQLVAWAGALFALLGGIGMLLSRPPAEKRTQTRLIGILLLAAVPLNIFLATRIFGVN